MMPKWSILGKPQIKRCPIGEEYWLRVMGEGLLFVPDFQVQEATTKKHHNNQINFICYRFLIHSQEDLVELMGLVRVDENECLARGTSGTLWFCPFIRAHKFRWTWMKISVWPEALLTLYGFVRLSGRRRFGELKEFFNKTSMPILPALYIGALLRKAIFTQCIYYVYIL